MERKRKKKVPKMMKYIGMANETQTEKREQNERIFRWAWHLMEKNVHLNKENIDTKIERNFFVLFIEEILKNKETFKQSTGQFDQTNTHI